MEVAGAGPQGTSGRGMMRAFIDTLSQIPSRLGLATNNEDDKAYQQRVMKSTIVLHMPCCDHIHVVCITVYSEYK